MFTVNLMVAQVEPGFSRGRTPTATDELLSDLPRFRQDETARVIEVAHRAFLDWRRATAKQRSDVLRRWYDLRVLHSDDLATLITLEEGKPLAEPTVLAGATSKMIGGGA